MMSSITTPNQYSYPLSDNQIALIEKDIIKALRTVYDPDIRGKFSIYELGLIYKIELIPEGIVYIDMTLTSANCPYAHVTRDGRAGELIQ